MNSPVFIDRIEKKYQVGISEDGIAGLWNELSSYLSRYDLEPTPEVTSVGSIYFDNRDYDLLRYHLLIKRRHIHLRVRAYEYFGVPVEPISNYWIEVKTREEDTRRKKRFKLKRESLADFFDGRDLEESVLSYNQGREDPEVIRSLYRETREMFMTSGLKPILLVTYKRVAFQRESERISLDWDIQYYHVGPEVYSYDSWKYLVETPIGRAEMTFLEFKYPQDRSPAWAEDLQRRYPIWERNYSKYVDGMGFLFEGSLKQHKDADFFLRFIAAYVGDRRCPPLR